MSLKSLIGFIVGLLALVITQTIPSPISTFDSQSWEALGLMILMGSWWITECIPVSATALVPIAVSPLMKSTELKSVTASYGHPIIFLFLGGFLLSIAIESSQLHRRIARIVMIQVGNHPKWQIAGLMGITAFLSMWMSNTATTIMMLPIGLSVLHLIEEDDNDPKLSPALLLGIAYAASIGGIATLIGTPPNALMAAYLSDTYHIHISFLQWMIIGTPFSLFFLVIAWYWLTKSLEAPTNNSGTTHKCIFRKQLQEMGPLSKKEFRVAIVFALTAFAWMFQPLISSICNLNINDTTIAIIAAVSLFIIPSGINKEERLLDWNSAKKLPWGVLLLFGGGLALAQTINTSGLAEDIGTLVSQFGSTNHWVLILLVIISIVFLTEITSNTATTASFIPILGPIAVGIGMLPQSLVFPAAVAASCAFMLPVATPPNAIVYGDSQIQMKDMIKAGFLLNLFSIPLILFFIVFLPSFLAETLFR